MILQQEPKLTTDPDDLSRHLTKLLRETAQQVNLLGDGRIAGTNNAAAAIPTQGNYIQGDFIRNLTPSEAGAAASKYVIIGWVCSVSGTPGTWLACRCLTGN